MNRHPIFLFNADTGGSTGPGTILSQAGTADSVPAQTAGSSPYSGSAWIKDEAGAFADGWSDRLPGDLRGHASLKALGSLNDLAKSYVETKAMVGKRLQRPGEGASREELAAWRRVVGAPEKLEGYLGESGTVRPDAVPEAMWDPAGEKKFLEIAHQHSLPPAAVRDILAYYGENVAQSLHAAKAQETVVLQAEGEKLRSAWGKEYDANLALSKRMAATVGLDPMTHPIFTSADVVQAFAKMGRLISEDRLVKGGAQSIAGTFQSRISEILDPTSNSQLAREYRGEFGPERQMATQQQLHQLYAGAEQE